MKSPAELGRLLDTATEDLDRIGSVLSVRLAAMADAMNGWPRSAWVGEGGVSRSNITFCEIHGKEHCECGGGTSYAANSDRTGETAMLTDKAAAHRRDVERALASIQRQARELFDIFEQYGTRQATAAERASTALANERDASCWSCARTEVQRGVARWEPARCSVEVAGVRRELCRWCQDWLRTTGAMPTTGELEQHHRGQRPRRRA